MTKHDEDNNFRDKVKDWLTIFITIWFIVSNLLFPFFPKMKKEVKLDIEEFDKINRGVIDE